MAVCEIWDVWGRFDHPIDYVVNPEKTKNMTAKSKYTSEVPELAVAMLACTRIGAIHSAVFAGFSASSLQNRIQDCEAKVLVTADAVLRAGRKIPPNANQVA